MSTSQTSTTAESGGRNVVHWFRKGLRLHDQPSLRVGLQGARTCRCIYILDPWFAGSSNAGLNKWRFLLQCLEDLDARLRKLNSRLFVIRGQPADVFPKLIKGWRSNGGDTVWITVGDALQDLCSRLESVSADKFNRETLGVLLHNAASDSGIKYSQLMQSLRKLLSGLQKGPGVAEMMTLLGKEQTLLRLRKHIDQRGSEKSCSRG
ncbi:cryptochrome-1-like [Ixodes scapularis]